MIAVEYKIEGYEIEELQRQFSTLTDAIKRKIVINAIKKCTKPLEDCMRSLCPVSEFGVTNEPLESRNHPPGYLKASIGTIIGRGTEHPTVWVRPRFTGSLDPWYEHFPMAGTVNMKKLPNPFVDKAWEQTGEIIEASLKQDLENNIQAEIDRL
jgi:hypothetical protein